MRKTCSIQDCNNPVVARLLCNKHYLRFWKHGDPNIMNRAPNGAGYLQTGYRMFGRGPTLVFEHRMIAERAIGKPLPDNAEIHHINGIPDDNRNSNLVICPSHEYHMMIHARTRALDACGNANWRKCYFCKTYDDTGNMTRVRSDFYHRKCMNDYSTKRYARLKALRLECP